MHTPRCEIQWWALNILASHCQKMCCLRKSKRYTNTMYNTDTGLYLEKPNSTACIASVTAYRSSAATLRFPEVPGGRGVRYITTLNPNSGEELVLCTFPSYVQRVLLHTAHPAKCLSQSDSSCHLQIAPFGR